MDFCGMNKTTLLDYPGHVAATLFTGGCNMRCPFCHNSGLVLEPEAQQQIREEEALAFLKSGRVSWRGSALPEGSPLFSPAWKNLSVGPGTWAIW